MVWSHYLCRYFLRDVHRSQAQNPFAKQLFYFVQIAVLLFGPSITMVQFLNIFDFK